MRVPGPETVAGRLLRGVVGLLRCLHPVAARRADLGEVLVTFGRPYPYRWWLHRQRRRRAEARTPGSRRAPSSAPSAHVPGIEPQGGEWEPDAEALLADALERKAPVVVFHDDGPVAGGARRAFIRPLPGPVARSSAEPWGGAFVGGPGPSADCEVERIDEVLLHRRTTPRRPAVEAPPASQEPIAVVVPSPGNAEYLERLFEGLADEPTVAEVVVVDNTEPTDSMDQLERRWGERLGLSMLRTDPRSPFNYSLANNVGARATSAPVIAFCNDDLELMEPPSLARLAGWLDLDGIGVCGPQLRYPDGSIQHGGVVIGLNGLAEHAFTGMAPGSETLIGNTDAPRDVSAVTGACLVTRRTVFEAVGGFDEELVLTGSDVWFCLRAAEQGHGTAYDGTVALVHHESAARGDTNHLEDVIGSARRWGHVIDSGDPFWSRRLAIHRHEPTLRRPSDPTSREMLETYLERRGAPRGVLDATAVGEAPAG